MDRSKEKPDFTSRNYWNERFQTEKSYDWLVKYKDFKELVEKCVEKDDKILMLGCGNSDVSEQMYSDGFHHIVNVDFSPVCIERMRSRHGHCPGMEWLVMDIKDLKFPDTSFDVVFEKGTLDALLAGERNPWRVSDSGWQSMELTLAETSRVLKESGRFISITFSQPHFRRPLLARAAYDWSVGLRLLGDHFHFFFFTMVKGEPMSAEDKELEARTTSGRLSRDADRPEEQCFFEDEESEETFLAGFNV